VSLPLAKVHLGIIISIDDSAHAGSESVGLGAVAEFLSQLCGVFGSE
jgi:hypothetical protein